MVSGVGKPVYLLHRMKGSDASWEDNNEPPPKCLDYSDDEEERRARRSLQSEERKVQI
jgi:H/ACA ribonucleoprotein complex non-core subunit NAF1